jgi:hypothetical protein
MHLAVVSGSMRAAVIVIAIVVVAMPSHASKSCMTLAEARAQFAMSHLYWHGKDHCWDATPTRNGVVHRVKPKERREAQREPEEIKPRAPKWREAMSEMLPDQAAPPPQGLPALPQISRASDESDAALARMNWPDRWVEITQVVPLALLARDPEPIDPEPTDAAATPAPKVEPLVTPTRVVLAFLGLVLAIAVIEMLLRATMQEGRRYQNY